MVVEKGSDMENHDADVSFQNENHESKKQLLKSTGIIGFAQIINILVRIVRTKIIAVLLGPAGVGIIGLYWSTLDLVRNVTSLGLDFSAVGDVANANSTGDSQQLSRTLTIVRRWVWITGIAGAAILSIFSKQFSHYTFSDNEHIAAFLMLAVVPLLWAINGGQLALLRGVRRIGDLARAGVFGSILGLFVSVPLYWFFGIDGIVPGFILISLSELVASWHFARKTKISSQALGMKETVAGGAVMVKLGISMVISTLTASLVLYLVRIITADRVSLDGVGQFQAAWNLSVTYVSLVLGAMGADFYPRLVESIRDDKKVCSLVNDQTDVGLLLGGPLIVTMIGFGDIIVRIFYSASFGECIDILQWMLCGDIFRIISLPMGFVLLAKNKGSLYIAATLISNIVLFGIVYFYLDKSALEWAGIAFLGSSISFIVIVLFFSQYLFKIRWTRKTTKYIIIYVTLCILAFLNVKSQFLSSYWRIGSGLLSACAIAFSFVEFRKIVDIYEVIMKIARKFGYSGKGPRSTK